MYKSEIGTNAGKIWRILKETREITLQDLAGKLGLSVEDTALAVGWLARENNIFIQKKDSTFWVSKSFIRKNLLAIYMQGVSSI